MKICRLAPEFAEDYVRFFDVTPHNIAPAVENAIV